MPNTKRMKVVDVQIWQGPLYEVMGEDEKLYVFDASVAVVTADDRRYVHKTFTVKGFGRDDEGIAHPNRNWRNEVEVLRARVEKCGDVDLAHWDELIEESFAEREAYNLRCEQDERAFEGWS